MKIVPSIALKITVMMLAPVGVLCMDPVCVDAQISVSHHERYCRVSSAEELFSSLKDGIRKFVDNTVERSNRLACMKSVCADEIDTPRLSKDLKEHGRIEREFQASLSTLMQKHDEALWKELVESDRVWRAGVGKFSSEEVLKGPVGVAANSNLYNSLALMLANSPAPRGQTSEARVGEILLGFQRVTGAERFRLQQNFLILEKLELGFYEKVDVAVIQATKDPETVKRAILSLWDENRERVEKLKKSQPEAFRSQLDFVASVEKNSAIEDLKSGKEIDAVAKARLLGMLARASALTVIFEDSRLLEQFSEAPALDKFVSPHAFERSALSKDLPGQVRDQQKRCVQALARFASELPTEAESAAASKVIEKARANTRRFWSGRFSKESSALMDTQLSKAAVVMPTSRERLVDHIKSTLDADLAAARQIQSTYRKNTGGQAREQFLAEGYALDLYRLEDIGRQVVLCESSDLLDDLRSSSRLEVGTGRVQFSAKDVRDTSQTYSTALHEFNHVVDPHVLALVSGSISEHSMGVREKIGECLLKQHGSDLPKNGEFDSVEDFADLHLPKRGEFDPDKPRGGMNSSYCSLVKSRGGHYDRESDFDDARHSPPVFILLNEAFRSDGKLTTECSRYVQKHKPWKFEDCLKVVK